MDKWLSGGPVPKMQAVRAFAEEWDMLKGWSKATVSAESEKMVS